MKEFKFNGFETTTNPLQDGDVAVIIREDGRLQVGLTSASGDGRELSASLDSIRQAYAVVMLACDKQLMGVCKRHVDKQIEDAMSLRIVN